MTDQEKAEHLARMELRNAAKAKGGKSLERFSELYQDGKEYEQIKNEELETLESVSGYIEARQKYIQLVESNKSIETYTEDKDGNFEEAGKLAWHEIDGEADLKRFRKGIQQLVVADILASERVQEKVQGLDPDSEEYQFYLKTMTQGAEQVAFNFLYSQHFFEMNQTKWKKEGKNIVRTQKSKHKSTAIQGLLMSGFDPVDVYISDALKDHVDVSKRTGQVITKHAHNWIKKNADERGLPMKELRENISEVVILPNEKASKDKFWTFDKTNGGYRLYIYSHIPQTESKITQMYMLENTKFDVNGEELTALEMMRRGMHIPWNSHSKANLFAETAVQAEKVNQYIQLVSSKNKIASGTTGGGASTFDWVNEINKSVSDMKFDQKGPEITDELIRGVVHASIDLDPEIPAPTAAGDYGLEMINFELEEIGFDANTGQINYPWETDARKEKSWLDKFLDKIST